jgi:hypothetical protein
MLTTNTPTVILILIIFLGFPPVILGIFYMLCAHYYLHPEDIELNHVKDVNIIHQSGESDILHLPIQYPPSPLYPQLPSLVYFPEIITLYKLVSSVKDMMEESLNMSRNIF